MNNEQCIKELQKFMFENISFDAPIKEAFIYAIEFMKTYDWKPIETAPRREPFIATGKTETPCVVTSSSKEFREADYPFACFHTDVVFHKSKFSLWMPLPKLPTEETK